MSDLKINVTGLSQLIAQVEKLPKDIQEEVSGEIIDSVMRINGHQRRLAPKDQGGLVRGIGYDRKQTQTHAIFNLFSNSEHSGYMEFGTKYRARVPAALTSIANEMRGPGISSTLKAKQAIYAWCKRTGIEKRAWYPIFVAIMAVGVKPHPFFFQPFFDESPKLLQRIRDILSRYSAKPVGPVVISPYDFVRNNRVITI